MKIRMKLAILIAALLAGGAQAQTWTGTSDGANWNTAGNWSPAVIPNSTTAAVIFANQDVGTINIANSVSAQSIAFNNTVGLYTITSSNLQKLNDLTTITVASGVTALQTINLDNNSHGSLLFDGTLSIVNNASAAVGPTLLIGPSTVIGTTGVGGLAVSGTGTTQISATFASTSNQVIGGITMAGPGQLQLTGDNSSLLASTPGGNIVVLNGGTLAINNDDTLGATTFGLELNTNSSTTGGLVFLNAGVTVTHAVDLNSTTRIVSNGTDSSGIYSVINGGGELVKDGTGTLTLANAGNGYSGGTLIVAGTLAAAADGAFGASGQGLTIGGGALEATGSFSSPRGITINSSGGTISVDSGAILTLAGSLHGPGSLNKIGPGTLTITADNSSYAGGVTVSAGTVTLGSANALAGSTVTLTANGVLSLNGMIAANIGGLAGAGSISLGGATLTVGGNNSSPTFAGTIADAAGGPGTIVKAGSGTLTLTGQLTNTGAYSVTGGILDFSGAVVQPGPGTIAAAAGATVEYSSGTHVYGGFLAGPGTHLITGATLSGVTTTVSAVIDQAGPTSFINVTNGGALTLTTGATLAGFTNQGSGAITLAAGGSASLSDFQSYGMLNLAPGRSSTEQSVLTNVGTTPLYFNGGSQSFIGSPGTADPTGQNVVAYIDLHGQNAIVAGGLFVNNGGVFDTSPAGTGTIIADYGALVKGAGFYQNTVKTQNGGKFQTGNSPGSATFGTFIFSGPTGNTGISNYLWQIDDAGPSSSFPAAPGVAGGTSAMQGSSDYGWSLNKAVQSGPSPGNFIWNATATDKLTIIMQTLSPETTVGNDILGPMGSFNLMQSYNWPLVTWQGTYSGPTSDQALDADTVFDTTSGPFANALALPFPGPDFFWNLDLSNHTLYLDYAEPVPEPGTLALVGLAAVGLLWRRRASRATPIP